jgi:hypothetical protein
MVPDPPYEELKNRFGKPMTHLSRNQEQMATAMTASPERAFEKEIGSSVDVMRADMGNEN